MGVAACFVSVVLALLGLYVKLAANTPHSDGADWRALTVHIRQSDSGPDHEPAPEDQAPGSEPRQLVPLSETAPPEVSVTPKEPTEIPRDVKPAIDWDKTIVETVAAMGIENSRREESRSSMWRKTHSAMFQPANEYVIREEAPVIPDFRFKPEIHVAGLGFKIGSCFIGLPIIGVPVEERTAAVGLFVCAKDSS